MVHLASHVNIRFEYCFPLYSVSFRNDQVEPLSAARSVHTEMMMFKGSTQTRVAVGSGNAKRNCC